MPLFYHNDFPSTTAALIEARRQILLAAGDTALSVRRYDLTEEASRQLVRLPTPAAQAAGAYFLGVSLYNRGALAESYAVQESIAAAAPMSMRARAAAAMAGIRLAQGCREDAARLYMEARHMNAAARQPDLHTGYSVKKMLAVLRSLDGDHRGAFAELMALRPEVNRLGRRLPAVYFDFLNSVSCEMREVGEARHGLALIRQATASPFVERYSEWRETEAEILAFLQAPPPAHSPRPLLLAPGKHRGPTPPGSPGSNPVAPPAGQRAPRPQLDRGDMLDYSIAVLATCDVSEPTIRVVFNALWDEVGALDGGQ